MPPRSCYGDRWQELAIRPALHLSLDAMTGRYFRYWPESWHHAGRALLVSKLKHTSVAIADCGRAPQQRGQILDPVSAPARKRRRHDHRRRWPERSQPGETHTRLSKKDRKLLDHVSRLRPERGIHLAKVSLATHPQFLVTLRSQPPRRV